MLYYFIQDNYFTVCLSVFQSVYLHMYIFFFKDVEIGYRTLPILGKQQMPKQSKIHEQGNMRQNLEKISLVYVVLTLFCGAWGLLLSQINISSETPMEKTIFTFLGCFIDSWLGMMGHYVHPPFSHIGTPSGLNLYRSCA